MANKRGVFIGAYIPDELKKALQQRAAAEHRTLSQEVTRILEEAVRSPRLPPSFSVPDAVTCLRCGHTWTPRVPNPVACAKCGGEWNRPPVYKPREGEAA